MPDLPHYHFLAWPDGGASPFKEWSEIGTVDPSSEGDGRGAEWSRLCENIVQWARTGKAGTTELFIFLPDDELRRRRDISYLRQLLTWAREHTWGARLFLVANDDIHLSGELREGQEALKQWLAAARQGKALDILQVDYSFMGFPANGEQHLRCDWTRDLEVPRPVLDRLRDAASRSVNNRQRVLTARQQRSGPWRCVLSLERGRPLEDFLFPLIQRYGVIEEPANLLVVVDCMHPNTQENAVKKARRKYEGRCALVATLGPAPSPELKGYCAEHELGEVLHLRGDFELWFLLLCLNEMPLQWGLRAPPGSEGLAAGVRSWDERSGVYSICRGGSPPFRPTAPGSRPTVLVTSSFNPEELGFCVDAACDVGWLVDRAPLDVRLVVDPATTRETLIRRIDRDALDPAIWIHLGHGEGKCGLWEAGSKVPTPTEKWLQCFHGRQLALPLALFLACESAETARSFAQAGVGVAIGFEGKVFSDRCRILADQVLKSVLTKGWQPQSILEGFAQGRLDLMALEDAAADPKAFVST
jgi:hypothetical protein